MAGSQVEAASHRLQVMRSLLLLTVVVTLAACAAPNPTVSPLRLPTRIPPTPTISRSAAALRAYEVGLDRQAVGDGDGALEAFSQALSLDPTLVPAYIERGSLYLSSGQADAALADAQMAIAVAPQQAIGYALLGEVLRRGFDDPLQALAAYEQAVRLDPGLADLLFQARWRTATAAGRANRMIALANEYLNNHPDDPLAAYYMGRALTKLGNPRAAIRTLVKALEQGGPAAVWFALGEAYSADGAWANARICYEQARALAEAGDPSLNFISDTPVADLFAALGSAYTHVGECVSAQIMLEHALAVGPDRPELHTLIGRAMICQTPTPTPTPYPWLSP